MPMADYAEWYRREQARKGQTGVPGAVGSGTAPGVYQPEYKRKGWGEVDKEFTQNTMSTAQGAASGYAVGGPIGAVVGATVGAAPGGARSARGSWDAAKEGDVQGVKRELGAVSPYMYLQGRLHKYRIGGDYLDPAYYVTKTIQELWGGPRTRIEEKRWERLKNYGFNVPKWVQEGDKSKKFDAYRKDLPPDYIGYDSQGNWVNNKFAKSRAESDLTGTDLSQSAAMYETFGSMLDKASPETKKAIGDVVLGAKQVQEFKGTLDVRWDENTLSQAQNILNADPGVQEAIRNAPKQYVLPDYELPWNRK